MDRFAMILDGLPACVTLMGPDGQLEHANRHALEYFGRTIEELKAEPSGSTFHPDDRQRALERWKHSVETGDPYDEEARQRGADGLHRWFHLHGVPLRDAEGKIQIWYLLQTDIDRQKRSEALLEGERKLLEMVARGDPMPTLMEALCHLVERTLSGSYCSIVLIDRSAAFIENGVAPTLPPAFIRSIIGRPVQEYDGPCTMAACINQQVISDDIESETRWRGDSWRAMAMECGIRSCWSIPFSATAGEVLGAFAIYYNAPRRPTAADQRLIDQLRHIVSIAVERTRDAETLKRNEALLREAQLLSSTGSFSWRVAEDQVTYSEQTYRTYEFDCDQPVTLDLIAARIHPEDKVVLREMIAIARGPGSDLDYEYRIVLPDRSIRHLHLVAHAATNEDGEREYIGAIQDVSRRRRSEEALDRTRSELARVTRVTSLGALTASIAHEVNQPLSGIITNAGTCLRMLDADPPNVEGALETARRTIRDGNRAADVIRRLRALFAKEVVSTEDLDLNEACREVIALSASQLRRNRVTVRAEFAEHLPTILGDRVQLQQVILNLILNASDAMSAVHGRRRQIVVRTRTDGSGNVQLTVQDCGEGFDPDFSEKLFQPFFTTKDGGMGMGLSISRSIVERHHGRLWASSKAGAGAEFTIAIPAHAGPTGPIASRESRSGISADRLAEYM
jgi:PAS domain S-box-containing protein